MAFTAQDVKTLREMTNVGMMDCKKALQATDGDMDKAVDWLREKGLAKAAKKAGQPAIPDLIVVASRAAGLFFSRFFGRIHIKVARLHVKVGAADAMSCAVMTAVVDRSIKFLFWVVK